MRAIHTHVQHLHTHTHTHTHTHAQPPLPEPTPPPPSPPRPPRPNQPRNRNHPRKRNHPPNHPTAAPPAAPGAIVATIEKANGLVNALLEEDSLGELSAVVVDELHMASSRITPWRFELDALLAWHVKGSRRAVGRGGPPPGWPWRPPALLCVVVADELRMVRCGRRIVCVTIAVLCLPLSVSVCLSLGTTRVCVSSSIDFVHPSQSILLIDIQPARWATRSAAIC